MYWTDDSNNRIYKASLNGSNSVVLLSTDLSCPGWYLPSFTRDNLHIIFKYRWNSMGLDQ